MSICLEYISWEIIKQYLIKFLYRHKDRIRERNSKKRRDESSTRRRKDDDSPTSSISSAMTIISNRFRSSKDDDSHHFAKTRSCSLESSSSLSHDTNDVTRILRKADESQGIDRRKSSPYVHDSSGVITASLTIPVQSNQSLALNVDEDIPYIEDGSNYGDSGRQQISIGLVRTPTAPPRRRQRSISGSDSSVGSNIQPITGSISLVQGYDSAVGSLAFSPPHNTTPSSVSSINDTGVYSSPPSWASTPPTSPDSTQTSVNYIPDE